MHDTCASSRPRDDDTDATRLLVAFPAHVHAVLERVMALLDELLETLEPLVLGLAADRR
jgi:hypothetical protein